MIHVPPATRTAGPIESDSRDLIQSDSQDKRANSDFISVVIPAYNSRDSLPRLIGKLEAVLNGPGQPFEIIVVDDGSPDDTWERLKMLKQVYSRLKIIRLLRNSGQHNALLCGLSFAQGSIVITMDDDLQNPPEEVPKLIAAIQKGYDLAIGAYDSKQHSAGRNLGGKLIDGVQRRIFHLPSDFQLTSFRAIRKVVVDNVLTMGGAFPYITSMLLSHTSRCVNVPVHHEPRRFGVSNYDVTRSFVLACNLLLSYSLYPIYLVATLCLGAFALSIWITLWALFERLSGSTLPGWASTLIATSFFSGLILFALVIHGLYLSRLNQQVTRSRVGFAIGEMHA
ncbi:MAG: glycosyltransferase family 2 protein [Bryobacterales bacterium]|nr:glycosyltransferase family 2 protein [Bryobacterales bacterium]